MRYTVDQNVEDMWDALSDYMCAPYRSNVAKGGEMRAWVWKAHDKSQGIELGFHTIQTELSPGIRGRPFEAFSLRNTSTFGADNQHDRIFISQDSAVLSVPTVYKNATAQDMAQGNGVQSAAFWLYDMPVSAKERATYPKVIEDGLCKLTEFGDYEIRCEDGEDVAQILAMPPTPRYAFQQHEIELLRDDLPAEGRRMFLQDKDYTAFKIFRLGPSGMDISEDRTAWHTDESYPDQWSRTVLRVLDGEATIYRLGENGFWIEAPPFTTTAHVAAEKIGTWHRAQDSHSGRPRVVNIMHGDFVPYPERNPWHIEDAPLSRLDGPR